MNKSDRELMTQYGITCVPKPIYFYKQHRYENFDDALRYAKIDTKRNRENTSTLPGASEPASNKHSHD
mgnify:CR=1 FL=1